jgi:Bax protein
LQVNKKWIILTAGCHPIQWKTAANMKKIPVFIWFLLTGCLWAVPAHSQKSVHKYIDKFSPLAVKLMHEYGIPASVIMGIAITESGAGTSLVCRKLHNHFGMVGKNKDSVKKMGYHSKYRQYPNDSTSYRHFCQVLKKRKLYASLKGSMDYELWIVTINKHGYASAKQAWVDRVLKTIRQFKLDDLDEED